MTPRFRMIGGGAALLVVGGAVLAMTSAARFEHNVAVDAEIMWSVPHGAAAMKPNCYETVPPPVRRYLEQTICERAPLIRRVILHQTGMFRPSFEGAWLPIKADQYFNADPPGFVWFGRVRMAPGLWIDAHDQSVQGTGRMVVRAESIWALADSTGPGLDESALARLLGELVWLPTTLIDSRYVQWTPVDDRHADATLTVGRTQATGRFEFDDHGFPRRFTASRYRDVNGTQVLTPFEGELADYQTANGMSVPHRVVGSWIINGKTMPYVKLEIVRFDFNPQDPP